MDIFSDDKKLNKKTAVNNLNIKEELYNLAEDLGETNNLANTDHSFKAEIKNILLAIEHEMEELKKVYVR